MASSSELGHVPWVFFLCISRGQLCDVESDRDDDVGHDGDRDE